MEPTQRQLIIFLDMSTLLIPKEDMCHLGLPKATDALEENLQQVEPPLENVLRESLAVAQIRNITELFLATLFMALRGNMGRA
tara:strand:- start:720 stop:968 length:249 start_codon:yes stop_codon:yes gene_type:complete